jgi:YihY family inner membrane protein
MRVLGRRATYIVKHPGGFALRVLKGFRANQGLLLAGAVAYYSLLSLIPLLILIAIALSRVINEAELLYTLGRYLEWLAPGQSASLVQELSSFMANRGVVGWILLVTMLFFSSLAFTVLENAMSVIFLHRVAIRRRRFLVSAILPYCYILCLGIGLLIVTVVSNDLQRMGEGSVSIFGRTRSLGNVSLVLLYLLGLAGEVFVLTSVYMVMPVGRLSLRVALAGGVTAALLWEISRHILVLRDLVAGQPGLRLADHGDHGHAEPGDRRHLPAARRPGDLGVRAPRQGQPRPEAEAVAHRLSRQEVAQAPDAFSTASARSLPASGMAGPSSGRRYAWNASVTSAASPEMKWSSIRRVFPAISSSGTSR